MSGPAGLDEQARGFQRAEDLAQLLPEFELADAAQASARNQAHVEAAARRFGDAQCVDSRIGELIEDDDPQLMLALLRHQPTNGRGLARAETAGNDVRDRHQRVSGYT